MKEAHDPLQNTTYSKLNTSHCTTMRPCVNLEEKNTKLKKQLVQAHKFSSSPYYCDRSDDLGTSHAKYFVIELKIAPKVEFKSRNRSDQRTNYGGLRLTYGQKILMITISSSAVETEKLYLNRIIQLGSFSC
jgi:hypothetical protein